MKQNQTNIKVALVDDHVVIRHALAVLLDQVGCFQVIFESGNGQDLIRQISAGQRPDVVILDLNMPEMDGHAAAQWLQVHCPEIRVLMLTMYDSEFALIRLLQAGVKGFMKKDIHPSELMQAIHAVVDTGYYYSSQTSSKLAGLFRDATSTQALDRVIMVDQEVVFLKYACSELTYKEIAREMHLNPRAVDGIRDSLFTKLDVKSRVGLAMYAVRQGLVCL